MLLIGLVLMNALSLAGLVFLQFYWLFLEVTVADTYKHLQKLGIQKLFTVQLSTNDYS